MEAGTPATVIHLKASQGQHTRADRPSVYGRACGRARVDGKGQQFRPALSVRLVSLPLGALESVTLEVQAAAECRVAGDPG